MRIRISVGCGLCAPGGLRDQQCCPPCVLLRASPYLALPVCCTLRRLRRAGACFLAQQAIPSGAERLQGAQAVAGLAQRVKQGLGGLAAFSQVTAMLACPRLEG